MRNRRYEHDIEQAQRWTAAQAREIGGIVARRDVPGAVWGYTDVPPEGGEILLTGPNGEQWAIERDGSIRHSGPGGIRLTINAGRQS